MCSLSNLWPGGLVSVPTADLCEISTRMLPNNNLTFWSQFSILISFYGLIRQTVFLSFSSSLLFLEWIYFLFLLISHFWNLKFEIQNSNMYIQIHGTIIIEFSIFSEFRRRILTKLINFTFSILSSLFKMREKTIFWLWIEWWMNHINWAYGRIV